MEHARSNISRDLLIKHKHRARTRERSELCSAGLLMQKRTKNFFVLSDLEVIKLESSDKFNGLITISNLEFPSDDLSLYWLMTKLIDYI